ncbi:ABC transporter ATP-binding protein [Aliiroseovarius halocynthiae]|uniref:ABC transporter ATP-binding protein n=1 Tax=Aliiroseovarius halocynthiae TaxID=985055 RepID=A0A545SX77_9RHOB|nr:ABC transporter ATP-binding protein [Aliiroseovarius halocynthiae]
MEDTSPTSCAPLAGQDLTVCYDHETIISDLDISIPKSGFTAIIGPNGCGKSTLLHTLGRVLSPKSGTVLLSGENIRSKPTLDVARNLGLLPQMLIAPSGVTVRDLVARGRYPHRKFMRSFTREDEKAVQYALEVAGLQELAERSVDTLSGGQRQRAWIAMVLAQDPETLLLDEPTSYLDIAHQIDLLRLLRRLCDQDQKSIVAVLHDLNQASRYADFLFIMKAGRLIAAGKPADVLDREIARDVFGLDCVVIADPVAGTPMLVPAN